jgi:salicylate hydroxylase
MSERNRKLKIAIVGAGIGGLTAAAALVQKGFEVNVYERAEKLGEVGAGLQMGPNAVKVIRALGLEDAYMKTACEPENRISLTWDTGKLRAQEQLIGVMEKTYGAPYTMSHRSDLHSLLMGQVPENNIHTGHACIDVVNNENSAVVKFLNGKEVEADIVIASDGIHSLIRQKIFGDSKPRFTEQICWRLSVPMDDFLSLGNKMPYAFTGKEYAGWIGPIGHVLFYPIRGGELLNIFAGRVSSVWADESWAVPSDTDEMMDAYAGWNDSMLSVLAMATEAYKWGIHDRDPLPKLNHGNIALMGDAAHPMMPTLAQGGAMAIEDGMAFARLLHANTSDHKRALIEYSNERQPRVSRVQLQARQQFLNNQLNPAPPPIPVGWIYGHDAVNGNDFQQS